MTEPRSDRDATRESVRPSTEPIEYPTNHVVGVLDTPEQVRAAAAALFDAGFTRSDITVTAGAAAGDALGATTGRTGLANLAIRIAERFGLLDEEMEVKNEYEQALRDGRYVVLVNAPTDDRKALAAQALRDNGGRFLTYLGRFSIEIMHR